jgi:S-DNA-T family DNA segregation ATPase FtsK/SpoIIIE
MSRKSSSGAADGFSDVIGLALLAAALLLAVAQWSFDPYDLASVRMPPNKPAHNWIGPVGAWLAHASFQLFGVAAYLLPVVLAAFGAAHLFNVPAHLRERARGSVFWTAVWLLSLTGLLHMADGTALADHWRHRIATPFFGGWIGYLPYEYGGWMLGNVGAVIVYAALCLISLVFLTHFRPSEFLAARRAAAGGEALSPEEAALDRRARELEKQARKLQEEVARSGLGPDLKPVPTPQIRDLTVPQPRPATAAKPTSEPAPAPAAETPAGATEKAEPPVVSERGPATTAEVLGTKTEPAQTEVPAAEKAAVEKAAAEKAVPAASAKPAEARPAEQVNIFGLGAPKAKKRKPITVAAAPTISNYQLPALDFLQPPDTQARPTETKEELLANARLMQQTLAQFDIEVSLGDITKGPTITRYELHPAPGVKLERITALNNNLAAALKAERIHILAPIPGKSSVGIEVPNRSKATVVMRDLFESEEWRNSKARIPIALGKDVYGQPIVADLAEMPHLLIAGSTGSGKSVCINAIITSLLYRFRPDELRFVMIDPKVVELQHYNLLPHLVVPVVTDPKKVILALRWVVNEMEKRYQIFARVGVRNIAAFNSRPKNKPLPPAEPELPLLARKEKIEPGAEGFAVEVDEEIVVPREEDIVIPEKLSYIVVIIDELADLMLVAPADVEMAIARITQMARAAGIHCIVATQRPSVDVITGVIKANITARIAFQCASKVDSRTILDAMGAEKLIGKGDMLYMPPGSAKLIRAQGALVTDEEIQRIVNFIAKQAKPSYEVEIHQQLSRPSSELEEDNGIDEDEELIQQCIEVIRSEQKASVSLLQRRLRLGYGRAARIMDELERRGIVGPSKGAEPRDILIDLDAAKPGADAPAPGP